MKTMSFQTSPIDANQSWVLAGTVHGTEISASVILLVARAPGALQGAEMTLWPRPNDVCVGKT